MFYLLRNCGNLTLIETRKCVVIESKASITLCLKLNVEYFVLIPRKVVALLAVESTKLNGPIYSVLIFVSHLLNWRTYLDLVQ